jgi:sugar lactone lactonase YvrE
MDYTAENIASGIYYGEAPRWHNGELWFSDFYAHQIKILGSDGTIRVAHDFPDQPSGIGWLPDGTLIASSMIARTVLAFRNGIWETYADINSIAGFHANDLVVNSNGDVYVGNFGFDLDAEVEARGFNEVLADHPTTHLALIKPDGSVQQVGGEVHFPNGIVITPDGSTLIVAETAVMQLTAFTIQPDGTLSDQRVWAKTPGLPDGICLDAEGCVWMAAAAMPFCFRIAEGGEIKDQVSTQFASYACMLGGSEGTDLYIMSAPSHTAHDAAASPQGCIAKVAVSVSRAGLP